MSIGMERFAYEPSAESRDAGRSQAPGFPYRLQCRACAFEPDDAMAVPPVCPKCFGSAWERFAAPRSLLMNADRRAKERSSTQRRLLQ